MTDPETNPETLETFDLEVAPRVRGLPPYLFGKINELKYRKRRDGIDVIDLGMGNPTDPPEEWVVDKLCEAARDSRNHRYSVASGVYNLRREVANRYESRFGVTLDPDHEVVATIGSKEGFSHMCLAILGPGDTALVPAPSFPIHVHAIALASANTIALDVRDPQRFPRQRRQGLREPHVPAAEDPGPQLPPQPDRRGGRAATSSPRSWQAGQEIPLLRDPRLRLRRHFLRRPPGAELPRPPRAPRT